MGSWGVGIFQNDTNSDIVWVIKISWLHDAKSRAILQHFFKKALRGTPKGLRIEKDFQTIERFFKTTGKENKKTPQFSPNPSPAKLPKEQIHRYLNSDEGSELYEVLQDLIIQDFFDPDYITLQHIKPATFQAEEVAYLLNTAALDLFQKSDHKALARQTLTCAGIALPNGRYKKAKTIQSSDNFYVLTYILSQFPLAAGELSHNAVNGYYFERFLEALTNYTDKTTLAAWRKPELREERLLEELHTVIKRLIPPSTPPEYIQNALKFAHPTIKPLLEQQLLALEIQPVSKAPTKLVKI